MLLTIILVNHNTAGLLPLAIKALSTASHNSVSEINQHLIGTILQFKKNYPLRYMVKFRGGSKHSSHGNTVEEMVRHIVAKIRKSCRGEVPILMWMNAGVFDGKLFKVFEELGPGHFCAGMIYDDIKSHVRATTRAH
jgi:hypothetical protein